MKHRGSAWPTSWQARKVASCLVGRPQPSLFSEQRGAATTIPETKQQMLSGLQPPALLSVVIGFDGTSFQGDPVVCGPVRHVG